MKLTETKQDLNLSVPVESVLFIIVKMLKSICDSSHLSPSMYFAPTSRNVPEEDRDCNNSVYGASLFKYSP